MARGHMARGHTRPHAAATRVRAVAGCRLQAARLLDDERALALRGQLRGEHPGGVGLEDDDPYGVVARDCGDARPGGDEVLHLLVEVGPRGEHGGVDVGRVLLVLVEELQGRCGAGRAQLVE